VSEVTGAPMLSEAGIFIDERGVLETLEESVSSDLTQMYVSDRSFVILVNLSILEESVSSDLTQMYVSDKSFVILVNLSSDSSAYRKDMDVT
jgi:hypothetical protein